MKLDQQLSLYHEVKTDPYGTTRRAEIGPTLRTAATLIPVMTDGHPSGKNMGKIQEQPENNSTKKAK